MNIAIVDDLQEERDAIRAILKDYAAANSLELAISEFTSAEEFLDGYQPFLYTVIFLDIYMDGMTGVDAAGKIRESDMDTFLIFLTTSEEHHSDAFMAHAFDYIKKPADSERVFRVIDDVLRKTTADVKRLAFTCDRQEYLIPYSDIMAVCTANHYLTIIDRKGISYKTRTTFSAVFDLLEADPRFLLIIRGVLVNMDYILDLKNGTCHLEHDFNLAYNLRQEKKLYSIWQNYVFASLRKEAMERRRRS